MEAERKAYLKEGEIMCLILSKVTVLVCLSCYNKIPHTEVYFLAVLEAGKSKSEVPAGLVSGESSPLGLKSANFFLCAPMAFLLVR